MSLDELRPSARMIVRNARMAGHPEHYSGRGATSEDLNGQRLEGIYWAVRHHYGEDAGKAFVQMVEDTPVLSATDFLLNLYRLEENDWKWDRRLVGKEKGVYVTDEGSCFATLADALTRKDQQINQTDSIKSDFIKMIKQTAK